MYHQMEGFASVWRLAWRQPIWCYFTIPAHHIHHVSQTSNTQDVFPWNLATMFRQRFKLAPISTRDACVACLSQRTGLIAILWMSCLASPDQMTKDYFSILPLNEAKVKAGSHQTPTNITKPYQFGFPCLIDKNGPSPASIAPQDQRNVFFLVKVHFTFQEELNISLINK